MNKQIKKIDGVENKDVVVSSLIEESTAVNNFISNAIEKSLPVETMDKLFALREKVKAEFAKEEFMKAMSNFQKTCPIIEKKNPVKNKTGQVVYYFANLGDIVEQVKIPLGDNNLSYEFITEDLKDFLKVTCIVTHALGHSKSSSFQIPIGTEAYMTDVQKYGARVTFAKRYAFCNALGILTADEDIDAKDGDKNGLSEAMVKEIESITTIPELQKYYEKNKGKGKEFDKVVLEHKNFILKVQKDENN